MHFFARTFPGAFVPIKLLALGCLSLGLIEGCRIIDGVNDNATARGSGAGAGGIDAVVGTGGISKSAGGGATSVTTPQETILFKMESIQGVSYNPPNPTTVALSETAYITRVWSYHYGATIGSKSPTIALQDSATGKIYGPWAQVGYTSANFAAGAVKSDPSNVVGPPDNYWMAYPGETVPAGTYRVIDSEPSTWAHTADQGNKGLTWIYGWYGGPPAATSSVSVAPSIAVQTIKVGDVAVTVPGGLLSNTAALTVAASSTANALPAPTAATQILGAYDISLGTLANFTQEVTLEFTYDPTKLDPSVPEGENLWVSSWDPERKLWSLVPTQVDVARHSVAVRTRHLSTWIYWSLKGYKYVAAATGYSPFEVYYHPNHAQPRTDVATGYAMLDLAKDVLLALTTARQAYVDAGFTVPNYQVKAIVTDAGDSNMDPYTGNIFLDRKEMTTSDILRHDSGHELFHVVQNQYFNIWGMDNRLWWIEGTPDYASSVTAWHGQTPLPELTPTYFDDSITLYDNVHAYQNSQFVHYLVSRRQLSFKAMWDSVVANSSSGDSGFAALQKYVSSTTGKTFGQVWTDFIDYALFDPSQPMQDVVATAFKLTDSAPAGKRTVTVPSYAAKAVYVAAAAPATGPALRHVVFTVTGLASGATVELWQLAGTDRTSGKLKGVLVDNTSTAAFELGANEGVEAVVINTGNDPVSVTVAANGGQAVITSISPNPALAGASVTITGSGLGPNNSANKLYFGTSAITWNTWSDTGITFAVPATAAAGTTNAVHVDVGGVESNSLNLSVGAASIGGNYTLALVLDWGTNNCDKQQTVGHYRLVRDIPTTVDTSGKFSINFATAYGYDNWKIEATGTYSGGRVFFSAGKWSGDVYSSSGSRMIANDSGTFVSNADGTITANYSNVMTQAEATNLSYPTPDVCSGSATVTASMSGG